MTRIGQRRHKITIEQESTSTDTSGQETVDSWATFKTRWARIEAVGAGEQYAQHQRFADADYLFDIRHTTGIDPATMRVSWDSRTFEIEGTFDPDGRRQTTHVMAREEPA